MTPPLPPAGQPQQDLDVQRMVDLIRRKGSERDVKAIGRIALRLSEAARDTQLLREEKHGAYAERNLLVVALAKLFPAVIAETIIDGWDPEWRWCVFITLPTGQASWHIRESERPLFAFLPEVSPNPWDGHDTPEKYRRLAGLRPPPKQEEA